MTVFGRRSSRLVLFVCLLGATGSLRAEAQQSTLVVPPDGAANVDTSIPFSWTATAGAQAYYLYVGTAPGLRDLVDSRELTVTSLSAGPLPSGITLYARLWTKAASVWRFADSTFTAASPAVVTATLTYPVDLATNVDPTRPIQWTAVAGAQAYYLYVGTAPGLQDLVNSRETQQTALLPPSLPSNQLLYVRLWTKYGNVWRFVDSTFTAAPPPIRVTATLIHPVDQATNVDATLPFEWTAVPGAQAYYLYVGTAPGLRDVVDSREIQQTTLKASGVPAGRTLYVRLWTKVGDVWRFVDSTFTAFTFKATLVYPIDLAVDVDTTRSIQWTSVADAQAYYLYLGSAPGLKDVYDSRETLQTSLPIAALPGGHRVYVRLWTKLANVWRYIDAHFTTAPIARLTYPTEGSSDMDVLRPFTWTPVLNAQAYYLYVGTTPGASNVVDTREIQLTSYRAVDLPPGQTLYARLWTKSGNGWRHSDSTFVAAAPTAARLIFPPDGASNVDLSQAMTWTPVPSASAYYLYAGTTPGAKDLIDSGEIQETTSDGSGILYKLRSPSVAWDPDDGDPFFLQEYALHLDGVRTEFGAMQPKQCHGPEGQTLCYRAMLPPLAPGSHAVGVSAYNSGGEAMAPEITVDDPGRTVYVRLWTNVGGVWRYVDSQFTAAELTSRLVYPVPAAIKVDVTKPLSWSAIPFAEAYSLSIGRTPGASDILHIPETQATSYLASTLPGYQPLFVRLGTRVQGVWRYREATFSAIPAAAYMTYPTNGATGIRPDTTFWWTSVPSADLYALYVGTSPGAKDVVYCRERADTFCQVSTLPELTTLHARLWTKLNGAWRFVDSVFTTAAPVTPGTGGQPGPVEHARFTLPRNGETVAGGIVQFRWTAATGAFGYHLRVGTSLGGDDIARSPDTIAGTEYGVGNIPSGATVYVRLYTKFAPADLSRYIDITILTRPTSGPSACPCSLWSPGVAPLRIEEDPQAVTLGVRFQSDRSGYVTGIRFYKAATNTGTHVGSLWTLGGALLGTVTFTSETTSGWQQATFASPIAITAGTVYVAAYFAPAGRYAEDNWYFETAFGNPPVHAVSYGTAGASVYRYGTTSAYPDQTYKASNYWVDVVFEDPAPPPPAPQEDASQSPAGATGSGALSPDI